MLAEHQSAVCSKGVEMKTITTVSIAVIGYLSVLGPVRAVDNCKGCRDFHRACLTAHSKAAYKTDYDISMKHCRQSSLLHADAILVCQLT